MDRNALKMVMGIVLIAVAFIVFPILLEGAEDVRTHSSIAEYTGMSALIQVAPTIIFIALLFGGGIMGILGIKGRSKSRKSRSKAR